MSGLRLSGDLPKNAGFAIPAAIFAIVVISLLALSGLYVAQNNAKASTGIRRSWKAFNAANAGAMHMLAHWDRSTYSGLAPGVIHNTGWRDLPDGSSYNSTIRRVDDASDPDRMLFHIRTIGRPGQGITAQQVLITMAEAVRPTGLCCDAAMKAQGLLDIRGTGSGVKVSGLDMVPTSWAGRCSGSLHDLPGILVQDDAGVDISGLPEFEGTPPIQEDPTIDSPDFTEFGDLTYWDLANAADKQLPDDLVLSGVEPVVSDGQCVTSNPMNWGDPLVPGSPCWDYLPVVHVNGDLMVSGNGYGQGVLLIDGDLTVTGNFEFYGVVIVLGHADFRGGTDLYGGLLVRNGVTADSETFLRGGTQLQYSSCTIARATQQLGLPRLLSGRHWFDVLE
jgi:hypothetical protein